MPVKSEKQRRFMYASLAGKTDVPPSVAKKFVGPSAHKESDVKMVKPPKPAKKMAVKMPSKMRGGMPYAKGGGVEIKGKPKKLMGGGKC